MKFKGSHDGKIYNVKFDVDRFENMTWGEKKITHDLIMIVQTPKPSFHTAIYETLHGETNMADVLTRKHYIYHDDGKTRITEQELREIFNKIKKELQIVQYELF